MCSMLSLEEEFADSVYDPMVRKHQDTQHTG